MQTTLTVSRLNALAASLLENNFPEILVEGEVSNLIQPHSGHWYFSLKDETAQIRCAMFRFQNQLLTFNLKNGDHITVKAKVSIYQPRGDYQLIVSNITLTGEGILKQRFEKLKNKLSALGWFTAAHKKNIPGFPQRIGVITSPTGAVIKDIARVLQRRCPSIAITVYPSLVQGEKAAEELVRMIQLANHLKQVDLIIIARGGGSLEDLWPFNEAIVAEAIFHSNLPVISAIGHETDFTIADFVADYRAPTPSAAAEIASPDQVELIDRLTTYNRNLSQLLQYNTQNKAQMLDRLKLQLKHPGEVIKQYRTALIRLKISCQQSVRQLYQDKNHQLAGLAQSLDNLSPLKTLGRGYALVSKIPECTNSSQLGDTTQTIHSITQIAPHDRINIQLKDGKARAEILSTS